MRELMSELDISGQATDIYFKKSADDIKALASFKDGTTQYSQGILSKTYILN